ncbi:MAG: 2-aminoadipate transaminase [Thermomicrobiales bacterium]|nr:2-aminoadipate transaminase [Thermomicrobiales bacterium]
MTESTVARTQTNLQALYSRRARDLPAPRIGDPRQSANLISFIYGFPDPRTLPKESVAAATTRALEIDGEWALQYGKTTGAPVLVEQLLAKLRRDQGIVAGPDNVLITAGGSQAVQLTLDLLVDWGDTVIVESPTWMGFLYALKNVGGQAVPVPVDDQGTDTDALERELARLKGEGITPKFIYVISNFQNPSGISTTLERRRRLVELAQEYGTLILEDDAYHDLRFAGERIPPIYTIDDSGSTMYLGTLSKIMGAGMRIGWLVASEEIVRRMSVLKVDGGTNIFGSHVAAEWIPGNLDAHIAKLREVYHRRRDLMLAALERHMPEGTTWTTPEGGFFIWVTLPEGIDATRMLPQAKERGVEYLPGATCYVDGSGKNQMRLSYSFAQDEQIEPGIQVISEIAKGELLEVGRR